MNTPLTLYDISALCFDIKQSDTKQSKKKVKTKMSDAPFFRRVLCTLFCLFHICFCCCCCVLKQYISQRDMCVLFGHFDGRLSVKIGLRAKAVAK